MTSEWTETRQIVSQKWNNAGYTVGLLSYSMNICKYVSKKCNIRLYNLHYNFYSVEFTIPMCTSSPFPRTLT